MNLHRVIPTVVGVSVIVSVWFSVVYLVVLMGADWWAAFIVAAAYFLAVLYAAYIGMVVQDLARE